LGSYSKTNAAHPVVRSKSLGRVINIVRGQCQEQLRSKHNYSQGYDVIQELPMEAREVIEFREYEKLTYHQIATVLNRPIPSVLELVKKARAKLKRRFDCAEYQEGHQRFHEDRHRPR
jgi:DNA-directed RNA polymerase specialized sigma subunit